MGLDVRRGPEVKRIRWAVAYRLIASRHPPIPLFERILPLDAAAQDALIQAEQRTNPRLRDEWGNISLVPPEQRISGPGAGYVMASFTYLNPKGSRFSDGSYGVYYAARTFDTALREVTHHFEKVRHDADDGPAYEDMRVLTCRLDTYLHDIRTLTADKIADIMDPDSYAASRQIGARLRGRGSNGVAFPSARHAGGSCVGIFLPRAVTLPVNQERHVKFHYDGLRVVRYFDYGTQQWHDIQDRLS